MTEEEAKSSKSPPENNWKELLFNLFYEIKSEIIGKKIEIDEEEYQDNLSKTSIPNLISYIHDSIQILITNKIETAKIEQKQEDTKLFQNPTISENANFHTPPIEIYEKIILKLEEKERYLTKIRFQNALQKEAMEKKIGDYMDMEDEFEEMKAKLKYENGRFLNNDRKDNEIIIIRSENSKLKNAINDLEKENKNLENIIREKDDRINTLEEDINKYKTQIEEKEAELSMSHNYIINMKNHNKKDINKCLGDCEENTNIIYKLKNYYNSQNDKEKNEHNNTVKYYKYQNMNLFPNHYTKVNPKIYAYKKKSDRFIDKKVIKESTYTNFNNNELLNTTRNEIKNKLKPKLNKYFLGNNNFNHIINTNNKKNFFQISKGRFGYDNYSYLYRNKNSLNNLSCIKKIISNGSLKNIYSNSSKKFHNNSKGYIYRSSSGE